MSKKNDLHGKFGEMVDAVLKPAPEAENEQRRNDRAQNKRGQTDPEKKTRRKRAPTG